MRRNGRQKLTPMQIIHADIPKPAVTRAGVETVEFSTVDAALACARVPNLDLFNYPSYASGQQDGNASWCGSKTFAEADRLAVEGWPDGLEQAEKMRTQLCGVLGSRAEKPRLARSVAGFSPCVPSAIAGDPENMFTTKKVEAVATGKIVTIVYNNCVSAGISAKTLMLRGAICLALVDTLESCGFRCEVQIGNGCRQRGTNPQHETFVTLKLPEDALNIDTLSFWLVHPSAFRRMLFCIWENVWTETCDFPGLGHPTEITKEKRGDIYLCEAHLANVDNSNAVDFLKSTLAQFGVEFES